jgi:hypothetical protein
MRILDFQNFSKIYEAEAFDAQTESTLKRILNAYFMCYGSLAALAPGSDFDIIKGLTDIQNKVGQMMKGGIGEEVNKKLLTMKVLTQSLSEDVLQDFKDKKVGEEWAKAADIFVDALIALWEQYKDDTEALDNIYVKIDSMIEEFKQDLVKSKQEADQKMKQAQAKNEGYMNESEKIFEGWFEGKKANIKNLIAQATTLKANLESQKDSKGLTTVVPALIQEVNEIIVKLSGLSIKKRSEIEETELAEIGNRLNQIPIEVIKQEEKTAKMDTANKEASAIYVQGLDVAENAYRLEMEVKDALAKKAEEDAAKKKEESRVKLTGDLDPDKISVKVKNPEVVKFQELVLKKFDGYKPFDDFETFKRFKRFGADGKFGNTTKQMVVALKGGFAMEDKSDVITQELMDKLVFEPLSESASPFSFLKSFDNFDRVIEGFDPVKAKDSIQDQSSSQVKKLDTQLDGKKDDEKDDEKDDKKDDDQDPKPKVDPKKVTEEIESLLADANKKIVGIYNNASFWEDFKGEWYAEDKEDEAVKEVFGSGLDDKSSWWYKTIRMRFTIPARKKLNESGLKKSDPVLYQHLSDEIAFFGKIYSKLKLKTLGNESSDTFKWSLRKYDGSKKPYSVDTDF